MTKVHQVIVRNVSLTSEQFYKLVDKISELRRGYSHSGMINNHPKGAKEWWTSKSYTDSDAQNFLLDACYLAVSDEVKEFIRKNGFKGEVSIGVQTVE